MKLFESNIMIEEHEPFEKLADLCLQESKLFEDMTDKSWNDYNTLDWPYPEIKKLEQLFIDITKKYIDQYVKKTINSIHFNSWCNIRRGSSYHRAHTHPNAGLILNYYVKTPKGSQIVYFNPSPAMTLFNWDSTPSEYCLDVKPGMLVASPPWLLHEVPPTQSEEERISISCNVIFQYDEVKI